MCGDILIIEYFILLLYFTIMQYNIMEAKQ